MCACLWSISPPPYSRHFLPLDGACPFALHLCAIGLPLQATFSYEDYPEVMGMLWRRILKDREGKFWRRIYKVWRTACQQPHSGHCFCPGCTFHMHPQGNTSVYLCLPHTHTHANTRTHTHAHAHARAHTLPLSACLSVFLIRCLLCLVSVVAQGLLLLHHLIRNGSTRVIDSARDHVYDLRQLERFNFIDEKGKDQGINVAHKAKELCDLLADDERLREERRKAKKTRNKMQGISSSSYQVRACVRACV